jgi:hypothetical protein
MITDVSKMSVRATAVSVDAILNIRLEELKEDTKFFQVAGHAVA